MNLSSDKRKGFALAVALAALVVIGGLITGVFLASTQEYRIGRNNVYQTRSLAAAEYGLYDAVYNSWNADWNSMGVGDTASYVSSSGNGAAATVRLSGLGNGTFQVVSDGAFGPSTSAQARRRIGALVALQRVNLNLQGALMTRGDLKIGGSSKIDGNDMRITEQGWNCPPSGAPVAGIAINDPRKITESGCSNLSCVSGDPKVLESRDAGADSTYNKFGDMDWQQLVSMATVRYGVNEATSPGPSPAPALKGTAPNQVCDMMVKNNWGDPKGNGKCKNYFPIIYAEGDMKLTGGTGQGILLVEGHLSVQGGFEFYGPVIVRKSLTTQGTGGHFNGGVMAANVALEQNVVLGNAVVSYSRCAIDRAVNANARPELSSRRSWVELY
jgi:Tfp pilus assembly protein PilX